MFYFVIIPCRHLHVVGRSLRPTKEDKEGGWSGHCFCIALGLLGLFT
jgi:hypothetical protein